MGSLSRHRHLAALSFGLCGMLVLFALASEIAIAATQTGTLSTLVSTSPATQATILPLSAFLPAITDSCGSHLAGTAPLTAVACAKIVLYNSQSVNTSQNYIAAIPINMTYYGIYAAPDMSNIEFYDQNGQVLPSWFEGNISVYNKSVVLDPLCKYPTMLPGGGINTLCNLPGIPGVGQLHGTLNLSWNNGLGYQHILYPELFYVKTNGVIKAHGNITIYVGFAPMGVNLFQTSNGKVGENPLLSSTYGQYDNGRKVFITYCSFIYSNLSDCPDYVKGGSGAVAGHGISLHNSWFHSNNTFGDPDYMLEFYGYYPWIDGIGNYTGYGYVNGSSHDGSNGAAGLNVFDVAGTSATTFTSISKASGGPGAPTSTSYGHLPLSAIGVHLLGIHWWPQGPSVEPFTDYHPPSGNPSPTASPNYLNTKSSIGTYYNKSMGNLTLRLNFIRIRNYGPNGVPPTLVYYLPTLVT